MCTVGAIVVISSIQEGGREVEIRGMGFGAGAWNMIVCVMIEIIASRKGTKRI